MAELDILTDLGGWFGAVWDQITSVDIQYLILGCLLQSVQTTLNGLAWRNILAESYGSHNVPVRPILASYAGGIGLNSFLPAQAGTFAYFGMFRVIITGSAFAGILAAGVVTLGNIFLIIAANSISSTFAVTPGGVGTQQAMASFALRDVAPASTVTAYSLSQQMICMAWNITFGLVFMASTFGWSATKDMVRESRKGSKEKRSLSDLEKQDEVDAGEVPGG